MRQDRLVTGGMGAFLILWILSAIASLAVTVGICYIAWHFISKFW